MHSLTKLTLKDASRIWPHNFEDPGPDVPVFRSPHLEVSEYLGKLNEQQLSFEHDDSKFLLQCLLQIPNNERSLLKVKPEQNHK